MHARCYLDGAWVDTPGSFPVYDPATGKQVGTAADAGAAEVDQAIGAAHAAFPDWSGRPGVERGTLLRRLSAELLDAIDEIADVIVAEQGKPRAQAAFEVRLATQWLDWYAEEARRTYGEIVPPSLRRQAPDGAAPARRRRAGDHAVELPALHDRAQAGTRTGVGLHDGRQAGRADAAGRGRAVRGHRPRRLPARSGQPRHGLRPRSGVLRCSRTSGCARSASPARPRWARSSCGRRPSGSHGCRSSSAGMPRSSCSTTPTSTLRWPVCWRRSSRCAGSPASARTASSCRRGLSTTSRSASWPRWRLKVGHGTDPDVNIGPLIDDRGYDKVQRHVDAATARVPPSCTAASASRVRRTTSATSTHRPSSPTSPTTC